MLSMYFFSKIWIVEKSFNFSFLKYFILSQILNWSQSFILFRYAGKWPFSSRNFIIWVLFCWLLVAVVLEEFNILIISLSIFCFISQMLLDFFFCLRHSMVFTKVFLNSNYFLFHLYSSSCVSYIYGFMSFIISGHF